MSQAFELNLYEKIGLSPEEKHPSQAPVSSLDIQNTNDLWVRDGEKLKEL